MKPLQALTTPACEACGQGTRFVGLESDPKDTAADICTYQCIGCDHVQAKSVARANGHPTALSRSA